MVQFRTYPAEFPEAPATPVTPAVPAAPLDQATYDAISTLQWFTPDATAVPSGATIQHVCRKDSVCPALNTCVMTPARMQDELQIFRGPQIARSAYLMNLDGPQKDFLLEDGHFVPKALPSAPRAEAYLHTHVKSYFAPVLHRAEPGATRVKMDGAASVGHYFVISLFEADAEDEAGRTYAIGPEAKYYK